MDFIFNLISFVLILSIIVLIHEGGHFVAAKCFNVYCGEFSLGMGPILFKKKYKETQYSIRALPIGGFVQMAGEEEATGEEYENIPYERTINGIKYWQKVVVMIAGVFMNVVLAFVLFAGINIYNGYVPVSPKPVVDTILEGSVSESVGLQKGDEFLNVTLPDGDIVELDTFQDVQLYSMTYNEDLKYEIKRGDTTFYIEMKPEHVESQGKNMLGITVAASYKDITFLESFSEAGKTVIDGVVQIKDALINLMKGIGFQNMAGPVGIFEITGDYAEAGLVSFLTLLALLSLNIGVFNLLPLPILDGGRIVIVTIEKIIGKPLNQKFVETIMYAAVILLILLMVAITFQDILRLF